MGNTLGNAFKVTIWGESHGKAIGCVIDGLPAGISLEWEGIKKEMKRRIPGVYSYVSHRKEMDSFEVLSGYFNNHTTGTPLTVIIKNEDADFSSYEKIKNSMRPGHADYTGFIKYKGFNDYRGGGHFSGRITAPLVFAGAIARQLLKKKGISISSHIQQIGAICDKKYNPLGEKQDVLDCLSKSSFPVLDAVVEESMKKEIEKKMQNKDSVGGIVECMVQGVPVGLGNPFFDSVESVLSHALFSIPAVKGVEFGDGFAMAQGYGSNKNDIMQIEDGKIKMRSNHNGGILGGITNGMPLIFRVAIKPTPSIGIPQSTVNIKTKENTMLIIEGRHDPCIVPRVVPVVESVASIVLLDIYKLSQFE